MDKKDIIKALLCRGRAQELLFKRARQARDEIFSGRVEVRSVIEYSNICQQACNYCGMSRCSSLKRYILGGDEFIARIDRLYTSGRRVIMIQAGESRSDSYFHTLYDLLKRMKNEYPDLTLIGSFGNLSEHKYEKLRDIGVDRYLLKFETSDPGLYKKVKPTDTLRNRLGHIKILKKLGFHVSSGNITGLPGQTLEGLADDLLLLKELDLPMGSTSIFIPNNMSAYAQCAPGNIDSALNFTAVLRIMCPSMLIPATSSLELVVKNGQYRGLMAGANVTTLHDGTPRGEENKYVIYKQDRYKPRDILFKIVKKAGLAPALTSLIREKPRDTLFYKLINNNLGSKRSAVYFEGSEYSYDDLFVLTSKFCSFLKDKNIREGQVVLLAVFDSIEFVVAFLSCIRMGVIVALADPQLRREEWSSILSELRPHRVLATDSICNRFKNKRMLKIGEDGSSHCFLSLLKRQPAYDMRAGVDRNTPAVILYTSGTTGKPKGVVHTQRDLFVDNFPRTVLRISGKDILFSCSRIHTSFGLGNSLLFPFHSGAGVILSRSIPNPFCIQKILELKPTLFFAVPSMYDFLLRQDGHVRESFRCVRLCVTSGEKLYSDVFRRWKSACGKNLLECYGSSEMCHPFVSNIPGREKADSCGKVVRGFQIKFETNGQIFYKGPSLFAGYHGDAALTRKKLLHGWFRSDDIGYMDEKGYIFIKGRSNLVFKSGGIWASILDIEGKLKKCGLIQEVVVTKKERGLVYHVSLNREMDGTIAARAIRRYCVRNLAMHEMPKEISIVANIPMTRNGKVDRKRLQEEGEMHGEP